jgi:hypothetical protein
MARGSTLVAAQAASRIADNGGARGPFGPDLGRSWPHPGVEALAAWAPLSGHPDLGAAFGVTGRFDPV